MGTKFRLKLVIHDEGTSVRAVMADGKRLILDYENSQARQVRVRAPLIDRDKFIENSKHWLSKGFQSTIEAHVDFRVKGLEKEVFEEIKKIRKSIATAYTQLRGSLHMSLLVRRQACAFNLCH